MVEFEMFANRSTDWSDQRRWIGWDILQNMKTFWQQLLCILPPVRRLNGEKQEAERLLEKFRTETGHVHNSLKTDLQEEEHRVATLYSRLAMQETMRCDLLGRCAALESENAELKRKAENNPPEIPPLFMPPGHFYSPIVDASDPAVVRATQSEAQPVATLEEFGIEEQEVLRWFEVIAQHYAAHPFPEQPAAGRRYHYANPAFFLADALALLAFLDACRPRRYIEIGAGYSSCAALDINEAYLGGAIQMTFIDPHPEMLFDLLGHHAADRKLVLKSRLQDVPLDRFKELDAGDILFIDSSHVAKTGSDVLDYTFRILPQLRPGVIVHIHDIFFPFEYPRGWIVEENRSWNEAYLLRAFLHGNPRFRVLYLTDWIYKCRRHLYETRMPLCLTHRGGSLWMQSA